MSQDFGELPEMPDFLRIGLPAVVALLWNLELLKLYDHRDPPHIAGGQWL
jgi:hypothetical protein